MPKMDLSKPDRLPDDEMALRVGDNVKLSEKGRQRFTEHLNRRGTVTAVSVTRTSYRVHWQDYKTAEFLHWSYLARDDDGKQLRR